jgi:hypothetical protein
MTLVAQWGENWEQNWPFCAEMERRSILGPKSVF